MAQEQSHITRNAGAGLFGDSGILDDGYHIVTKVRSFISEQVDKAQSRPHYEDMEPVSRPELDAKLEAIEARMDARVASIEGKIDTLLATLNERDRSSSDRFARVEVELASIATDTKNFKWWLVGLIVPTAVGTVIAVAALNSSIVGNVLDGIGAGKDAATASAQVQQQIRETQLIIEEARQRSVALPPPASSPGAK